ncbi:hypothetical protein QEZ54_09615 [Catellatospora sp. KI3]|uniref:hypothetical protein n=1 Tax=Catellatospora sp. KI3 TaxID=3041620 RepID=UPI002482D284|nr:hypothetical protein [Catellatospora sp. KI3]MDI1461223.1 hypothetical protein [Catellatospora sp. KI3]
MTAPFSTGPVTPAQEGHLKRRVPIWVWVAGNVLGIVLAIAVTADAFARPDDPLVMGVMVGLCIYTSLRLLAAPLEWYLTRQYAYRSIAVVHLVGVGMALMVVTSPSQQKTTQLFADEPLSFMIGVYLMTSTAGLFVAAGIALVKAVRRKGRPPERRGGLTLGAISAVSWFNTVFLIAAAILIAPSLAAQSDATVVFGFLGGLMIAVLLRLPGVLAEWWLTKRKLHTFVYAVHVIAGLLTGAISLTGPSPDAEAASTPLDAGGIVAIYLMIASAGLLCVVAVAAPVRALIRRTAPGTEIPSSLPDLSPVPPVMPAPVIEAPSTRRTYSSVPPERSPVSNPAVMQSWTAPVKAPSPDDVRLQAVGPRLESPPSALVDERARQSPPSAMPTAAEPTRLAGAARAPEEPHERAARIRNEVATALGIVVGLASLVQGVDSADPFRTVVVAALVGVVGLGAIYLVTIRK